MLSGLLNLGIRKTNTSCPVLTMLSAAFLILLTLSFWTVELHITGLFYVKTLHIEMIGTMKNINCTLSEWMAWSSHWEAASPRSDIYVNIMNLILLKYLVHMYNTFFNAHSLLCISHDFDDQKWIFPYATLHSWSLFWFCEIWTAFLCIVWVDLDFKGLRIWPVLWR